jgi:hypothetical protein
LDNWFYLVPQFIRHLPDRWQCFEFSSFVGHLRLLSLRFTDDLSVKFRVLR